MRNLLLSFLLFSCCIACKKNENKTGNIVPHINNIPQKVFIYKTNSVSNTDSLIYEYTFYRSNNQLDSISAMGEYGYNKFIYDSATGNFATRLGGGLLLDVFHNLYDATNNLYRIENGINNCDGYYPDDRYDVGFNSDNTLRAIERYVYSTRCGGASHMMGFRYSSSDTMFIEDQSYGCYGTDTVLYHIDSTTVSNLPIFFLPKNKYVFQCGKIIPNTYFPFFPACEKAKHLIKEVHTGYGVYITYDYVVNADQDVQEMRIKNYLQDGSAIFYKFKFEY